MPRIRTDSYKRQIIPSCAYQVQKKDKMILEAWLATCVGVTLCDRQAGVGGLVHLLLPEPTGTNIAFQPSTYASTGLPLLISDLLKEGAALARLEACVAGGGLVAPVTPHDMQLNIGGRTTDLVLDILAKAGIPVQKAEVGGYGSWSLSLDCHSWEGDIKPLWQHGQEPQTPTPAPDLTRTSLEKAIAGLKPIPQVALKIIQMAQGTEYDMGQLAREVRQDQFMSGKILSLCNSAAVASRGQVDSIQRALTLLGERAFVQLALSACLEGMFPASIHGYSLCQGGLFFHAVGTAKVAEELARFTGRVDSELAFTAGLLHDIGKIILDQYLAAFSPYFYRTMQQGGMELLSVEREKLCIDHAEVGRRLGEDWGLPANLIDVIAHHHDPDAAMVAPELVTLVYLADLLMTRFQPGDALDGMNTGQLKGHLLRVGLGLDQFPVLADRMPRSVFIAH